MNLSSYLHKRPNSQNWQLRWMVPQAARDTIGRAEFTKSLGVSDRRKAEAMAFPILSEWRARVELALNGPQALASTERLATDADVDDYLASYFDLMRRINTAFAREHIRTGEADFEQERSALQQTSLALRERLFSGNYDDSIRYMEGKLAKQNIRLPVDPDAKRKYAARMMRTLIDGAHAAKADMDGDGDRFEPSPFIVEAKRRKSDAGSGEAVMQMFEKYASQRLLEGVKRPDGINQDRIIVKRFAEHVGENRRLSTISRSDVRDWRDALAKLPRSFKNSNLYKNLKLSDVVNKAAYLGAKPISTKTQNKYLSALSSLFKWSIRNGYIASNPCEGLALQIDKSSNPYPTFSCKELNAIVSSPLFCGFEKNGFEDKPGVSVAEDWRKWVPLVCLFTGSRIGEIAQLKVDDVRFEHERFFLDIKNDPTKGQRTKSGKSRIVPVHRSLEALGFPAYHRKQVARAAKDGNNALFPELIENARQHIGATPSRFWRRYLMKIGLKSGADGKGAHSFRHTLADEFRAAGFMDDQFGPLILGHHKANVTAGYGRLPQGTASMLCGMIDAVAFSGVDFTPILHANEVLASS